MKTVLFLSYFFPPMGGIGVQRVAKFCKYLPQFDYQPVVVSGKSTPAIDSTDSTLMQEVKNISRYEITIPKYNYLHQYISESIIGRFLNMNKAPWLNEAKKTGALAIQKEKPDLICVTVSPFPMAEVGNYLSTKYDIPWVLDMRDPWALDPIQYYPSKIHYLNEIQKMKTTCRRANAVIMNTPDALEAIRKNFSDIDPDKFISITNGWDADDFVNFSYPNVLKSPTKPLRIVHTGVFQSRYALTVNPSARKNIKGKGVTIKDRIKYSVGKPNLLARTPYYLFNAISNLLGKHKISKNDIQLIFAGSYTPEDEHLAKIFNVKNIVKFLGYLNHDQSVKLLNSADVLFLPLHEPEQMLPLIVPGKTYEYLAAKRPILAALPKGDARNFVEESGLGYICEPTNVDQIASTLLMLITSYKNSSGICVNPNHNFIEQFERKKQSKQLARLFDKITSTITANTWNI